MKNTLEGIKSKLSDTEEHISNPIEQWKLPNQNIKKKNIFFKNENSLKDNWYNIKCTSIHIIDVPEGEERDIRESKIHLMKLWV